MTSLLALVVHTPLNIAGSQPPTAMMLTLPHTRKADDDSTLTYYEHGDGLPVILLHGYNSFANPTWIDTGIDERLARDRHRLNMSRQRGHDSSVPGTPANPRDALVDETTTGGSVEDLAAILDGSAACIRSDQGPNLGVTVGEDSGAG